MNLSTFVFTDDAPKKGKAFDAARSLLGWAARLPAILDRWDGDKTPANTYAATSAIGLFAADLQEANETGTGKLIAPDIRDELEALARRCAPIAEELGIFEDA